MSGWAPTLAVTSRQQPIDSQEASISPPALRPFLVRYKR